MNAADRPPAHKTCIAKPNPVLKNAKAKLKNVGLQGCSDLDPISVPIKSNVGRFGNSLKGYDGIGYLRIDSNGIISSNSTLVDEDNILASNQGRAYFTLAGYHFNPDDITRLLGIEPTSVNGAGANSGLDKPVISSWELSTHSVTDDVDVFELTNIIIKQLEPVKEKILQVIESHNLSPRIGVVLTLSVDKDERCPEVGFGARTIRFLAELGAFINVDYQLSERI